MKKTIAFTLAETLIVMGIIGVVAALTLPNLNSSTGEKEKVAKLQKIYSNLQDALGRAEAVYGPYEEWFINDGEDMDKITKRTFDRITEFLKYSKNCTISNNCNFTFDSTNSDGDNVRNSKYVIFLQDGATVGFSTFWTSHYNRYITDIYVDIDGNKGANEECKDYFKFNIRGDSKKLTHGIGLVRDNSTFTGYDSFWCATWIIVNGNMDYLKLGSDGKCPDGQYLQFGVKTSCK